jgi:dTMP kinase
VLSPSTGALDIRSEVLLYAASRAEHVDKVIRPTIEAGEDIVCDRFIASSLAYQGYGRQLVVDDVAWINDWGTGHLRPDLTILVDVPVDVAVQRMDRDLDRLEDVGEDFRQRVAEGYRSMADEDGWAVVDGSGSIEDVFALVLAAYEERLG